MSRALHLINGDALEEKIHDGVAYHLLGESKSGPDLVRELYLRSLSRAPTESERVYCEQLLEASESKQAAVEDLLWALLNSREFAFNH
jgi:hypothetical protein